MQKIIKKKPSLIENLQELICHLKNDILILKNENEQLKKEIFGTKE